MRDWLRACGVLRSDLKGLSAHRERRFHLERLNARGERRSCNKIALSAHGRVHSFACDLSAHSERRSDLRCELIARRVLRFSSNDGLSTRREMRFGLLVRVRLHGRECSNLNRRLSALRRVRSDLNRGVSAFGRMRSDYKSIMGALICRRSGLRYCRSAHSELRCSSNDS